MLFPLFFPPVWGDEVYSDVQERFNEGRPKAGNTGAFWEQQSKALTWHYSHAIGSRIQKRGKVIRCRTGLLLACTKVWGWKNPDLRQQDQSNRGNAVPIELCWEWKQRGPKRNIHLGGGKGKVIAEQQRMVEADGWVQWTCGGQWSERERERERSVLPIPTRKEAQHTSTPLPAYINTHILSINQSINH